MEENKRILELFFKRYNPLYSPDNGEFSFSFKYTLDIYHDLKSLVDHDLIKNSILKLGSSSRRPVSLANESTLTIGTEYKGVFQNTADIKFYPSLDDLIQYHSTTPPKYFIIHSSESTIVYDKIKRDSYKGKLKHYLEISYIWELLSKQSEDSSDNHVLFLFRKKLYLTNSYKAEILDLEFDGLTKLKKIFNEKSNKTEKNHILQNLLCSYLCDINEDDRFAYLLTNFSKFADRFDDAYQSFAVGFSFNELRCEYEEKYREYILKINDSISSTITKLFALPASVYLTTTKVQAIQSTKLLNTSEVIATNIGIAFVSFLVSLFIIMMAINEHHSLETIRSEFKSLMYRLNDKSKHASVAVEELSSQITARINFSEKVYVIICIVTICHALISIIWILTRTFNFHLSTALESINCLITSSISFLILSL
jgi:hypothetical protein